MTTVYEKNAIVEEEKFLKYNSIKADNDNVNDTENELLINLSLSTIWKNLYNTIIDILNDLTDLTDNKYINSLVYIFFKQDRMIYLDILVILISIFIYMIDIGS